MTDELNPVGHEPWTGYHAGLPAPPPAQPGGGGPHRARGWIALLVAMLVSLALIVAASLFWTTMLLRPI